MKLSVIIPVLNEKDTLEIVIRKVLEVDIGMEKEIIIVNDNSTDSSPEIMERLRDSYPARIKIVHEKSTRGKGNAIKDALPFVTGDIIIIQDADLEYDIEDYKKLIKPFEAGADLVLGSRFTGRIEKMHYLNFFANKLLTFIANALYSIRITDESTAYKLVRADVFRKFNMQAKRFEFCPEILAKAARGRYRIIEVPITYRARTIKEGKKIKWYDLFAAIWTLVKYRFVD